MIILRLKETSLKDRLNIKLVYKNYSQFTKCISEINNTQVDSAKDFDVIIRVYNVIVYDKIKEKGCVIQ